MRQVIRKKSGGTGIIWILGALALLLAVVCFAADAPADAPATQPALVTFFIAGDSTAANGGGPAVGWGKPFPQFFDPAKAKVVNEARGGASSRTFVRDFWEPLVAQVKTGDYMLIQFGHNDIGEIDEPTRRGSLPGIGDESKEIDNPVTKKKEVVHTFGWYMKKMIDDTKAKGGVPIVLSMTARSEWKDGKVERGMGEGRFVGWSRDVAKAQRVAFIDFTNIIADRYEQMGMDTVKPLFPRDTTHTSDVGAELNARTVVAGLKALHRQLIIQTLSAAGRAVDPASPTQVVPAPSVKTATGWEGKNFLNEALPGDPSLPSIILIGDSTVRNGRADGSGGQWGWGEPLAAHFDPAKVNVVNRAMGGTTSGSFYFGQWNDVIALVKKGDFVLMQFGTNSGGVELRGIGDETEERDGRGGQKQIVRTYGGYMRQFIADVKAKGATPMVCTLIPRNSWQGDKITRPQNSQADWARAVAKAENVPLLDLYETMAQKFDSLGKPAVDALYMPDHVHTNAQGAEINAGCVVAALHALPDNPTAKFERAKPATTW